MPKLWRALRRGAAAAVRGRTGSRALAASDSDSDGSRFAAAGRIITCPHCGGDRFAMRSAQLNTAVMSFLDLDWANRTATTLVGAGCGCIQWFMDQPESA